MSVAKGGQIKTQIKEIEAFIADALHLAWRSMYTYMNRAANNFFFWKDNVLLIKLLFWLDKNKKKICDNINNIYSR